eukprot:766977-Hanusia_phi.AAC.3
MAARAKRKREAKDVDEGDLSKLRLYCPFLANALMKAGRFGKKKEDKKKPQKGDDDFDSDDEEAEMLKKKKEKARAKAKSGKKEGKAKGSGPLSIVAKGIRDVLDYDPNKKGSKGEGDGVNYFIWMLIVNFSGRGR